MANKSIQKNNGDLCNFDRNIVVSIDNLSHCRNVLLEMFDDKDSRVVTLISNLDQKR